MKKEYIGERFLANLYKEMYKNLESHRSNRGAKDKFELIHIYLDRVDKLHKLAKKNNKMNTLKAFYYDKYVIKKENIPSNIDDIEKKRIIKEQKKSLDRWINYFSDESTTYPVWAKYWAFQGMLKIGTYDEAHETFMRRNNKTLAPFCDINPELVAKSINSLEKYLNSEELEDEIKSLVSSGSFQKIYTYLEKKHKENLSTSNNGADGQWIKYFKGNKEHAKLLAKSLENKNTGWCTASEDMAINQLCGSEGYVGGDFYVYYTKDDNGEYKNPRIAIRMDGTNHIGEIRGIETSQNMEECMVPILEDKLNSMKFISVDERDKHLDKIDDLKDLTIINQKMAKGIDLTEEEIYKLNTSQFGFGWENDPRAESLLENRDMLSDLNTMSTPKMKAKFILNAKHKHKKFKVFDYDIAKEMIKMDPLALSQIDAKTPNYELFALDTIKKNPYAIEFVDTKIPSYKKIALAAALKNYDALNNIKNMNEKDMFEILLEVVKNSPQAIDYINSIKGKIDLWKDSDAYKKLAIACVREDGMLISKVNEAISNTSNNRKTVNYNIEEEIDGYKDIAIEAVRNNPQALKYIDDNIDSYPSIAIEAVKRDGMMIKMIARDTENYKDIAIAAVRQNIEAYDYISSTITGFVEVKYEVWKMGLLKNYPQLSPFESYTVFIKQADFEKIIKSRTIIVDNMEVITGFASLVLRNELFFNYAIEYFTGKKENLMLATQYNGEITASISYPKDILYKAILEVVDKKLVVMDALKKDRLNEIINIFKMGEVEKTNIKKYFKK